MTTVEIRVEDVATYEEIVFIQGDEARALVDALFDVEGVVAHGATQQSITAAVEILAQYDGDDNVLYDVEKTPVPWSHDDKTWVEGQYILSAHLGLGHISLAKIITTKECAHNETVEDGTDADGSTVYLCQTCKERWNGGAE